MDSKIRTFLILILILGGAGLFYLNHQQSLTESPKRYWKYRLKEKSELPTFSFKANTTYTCASQYGFKFFYIKGKKLETDITRPFLIFFPQDTSVTFGVRLKGIWFETGKLEIWEGKVFNCNQLIFVTTDRYSDCKISVQKGMRMYIPKQKEWYYMGHFNKDKFISQTKVDNHSDYYFRFWNTYDLRFRAVELPFLMEINFTPYFQNLIVEHGAHGGWNERYDYVGGRIGDAYILEQNEVIETPFWLDAGDNVSFDFFDNDSAGLKCSTDGRTWRKGTDYEANKTGFLQIKGKRCVISRIKITHNKRWFLTLRAGQTKRIKVYPGDIILSSCEQGSKYYIDGQIYEGSSDLHSHTRSTETYLEFKGSLDSIDPIEIYVFSRRGY